MKYLIASACLAVASVASAAELKDPAMIAAEWERSVLAAHEALTDVARSLDLPTTSKFGSRKFATDETPPPVYFVPSTDFSPRGPKGKQFSPRESAPKDPRAKEWKYRGESYWLVPLTS